MVLEKKSRKSVEKNFSWFLFTSKNVASGYTLCHLENRDMEERNILDKLKCRKNTTLNTEGQKSGTKRTNVKMT